MKKGQGVKQISKYNGKNKQHSSKSFFMSKMYWISAITIGSFFLSASLTFTSGSILSKVNVTNAFIIVLFIIVVNVIFDIIGIASTAANKAPFHAMASKKLYGAKMAIKLIKNAEKVSSFCNDVVGDICGVISGAAGAYIITQIAGAHVDTQTTISGIIITGIIACLTVGGKASGKIIAIHNSNYIIYKVAVILTFFTKGVRIKKTKDKT